MEIGIAHTTLRLSRGSRGPKKVVCGNGFQIACKAPRMDRLRPEYEIAMDFLRLKSHVVGPYSSTTSECVLDGIPISDLGLICVAQTYRLEWLDYLDNVRFAELPNFTAG